MRLFRRGESASKSGWARLPSSAVAPTMSWSKTWLIQSMTGGVERKLLVSETGWAATRPGVRLSRSYDRRLKKNM